MSAWICFDRVANAKSILKSGISPTSNRARRELKEAAWYLINHTTYSRKQIEKLLYEVSKDYFAGMPEEYITTNIKDIISYTQKQEDSETDEEDKSSSFQDSKPVVIYRSELDKIEALGHTDTERLAFVFLAYTKYLKNECERKRNPDEKKQPLKYIHECNSELYRLAWWYVYDEKEKTVLRVQSGRLRVGGSRPAQRVTEICKAGIVKFVTQINFGYKFNQDSLPAISKFTVPILCDSGEIAFVIDKMDEESLVLYYDRYQGYGGITDCCCCGQPVFKSNNKKKYCRHCAEKAKRSQEKSKIGA